MIRTQLENVSVLVTCLGMAACSAAPVSSGVIRSGQGGSGSNGGAGNVGGSDFVVGSGGNGLIAVDGGRPQRCDAAGDNCVCMNIAEIGTAGQFGSNPGQDGDVAFQSWMNDPNNSNAHVDLYKTKPTLDATFLANYDILVLQSLSDNSASGVYWTFSQAELDAVAQWVNDGGAIISLMGYSGNTSEINPTNQLLKFSNISYNSDDIIIDNDCTMLRRDANGVPNGQPMCYCDTAIGITDWNTDPAIKDIANHDPSVSSMVVGAYHGRSINVPSGAVVAATFKTAAGPTYYVAVGESVGKGHVFAYCDEWITYTSQWNGTGDSHSSEDWCQGYLPQQIFQTAQFWFNMIKWSLPDAACFQIHDTQQPVLIW